MHLDYSLSAKGKRPLPPPSSHEKKGNGSKTGVVVDSIESVPDINRVVFPTSFPRSKVLVLSGKLFSAKIAAAHDYDSADFFLFP